MALGAGLQLSQGTYQLAWLLTLLVLLPWLTVSLLSGPRASERQLLAGFLAQSLFLLIHPGFWFRDQDRGMPIFLALSLAAGGVAAVGWGRKRATIALSFSIAALLLARLLVLAESPQPNIDVFSIGTLGAERWLSGVNPYLSEYPDIYHGKSGYRAVYLYWPSGLYLQSLARWLGGDIRLAFVACEALAALCLFHWFPTRSVAVRLLWLNLWLSCPASLVMLENSWIDTFLLFFLVLMATAWRARRALLLGLAAGCLLATKQYAPFFAAIFGAAIGANWRLRQTAAAMATSIMTGLLLFAPFLIDHPLQFYESTVAAVGELPMRKDGLTLQSLLWNEWHISVSQSAVALLYLASALLLTGLVWRRPYLQMVFLALAIFMTVFCLFGKQAFLNYYYLLWFFFWAAAYTRSPARETL